MSIYISFLTQLPFLIFFFLFHSSFPITSFNPFIIFFLYFFRISTFFPLMYTFHFLGCKFNTHTHAHTQYFLLYVLSNNNVLEVNCCYSQANIINLIEFKLVILLQFFYKIEQLEKDVGQSIVLNHSLVVFLSFAIRNQCSLKRAKRFKSNDQ